MSEHKQSSRRRFLKIAGGVIVTTAAVGGGLIAVGSRRPEIEMKESTYPGKAANARKILVAYASKCGSTGDVADAIGQALNATGLAVDVRLVKQVTDVTAYTAVIVGSAIRIGNWLPEAVNFIKTYQQAFSKMPMAYFEVCGELTKGETEATRRVAASYLDPILAMVKPIEIGLFAGKMDYSKLSFLERVLTERFIKSPEGDWRNWEQIRAWAGKVGTLIA